VAFVNLFVDGFCVVRFLLPILAFVPIVSYIPQRGYYQMLLLCGLDLVIDLVDGAGCNNF
jgi:hypothetical protein